MDTYSILIEEAVFHCNIGCTEEERSFPQRVSFNIELEAFLPSNNAELSNIKSLTDYAAVNELCGSISTSKPWITQEELASELCRNIFDAFQHVFEISIEIHKLVVPNTTSVGIRMTKERD